MAELTLRERLQPALFDRLIDDERLLTVFEVRFAPAELERLGLTERNLIDIITTRGPRLIETEAVTHSPDASAGRILQFSAPSGRVSLSQLKSFVVRPPNAPQGVPLQAVCGIDARNVMNDTPEGSDRRHIPSRRLREYVCRDIASLLNAISLETQDDLSPYPHVQRSVLNYGMPSLAGRSATSIDTFQTASAIEEIIRRFEPRLTKLRVTPDTERTEGDAHQLGFRIEAELWGQPAPQQLVLRTRISTESGDVAVTDTGTK
jgi:type VI secretion system protein ImpF